jgi:hypothetical protein
MDRHEGAGYEGYIDDFGDGWGDATAADLEGFTAAVDPMYDSGIINDEPDESTRTPTSSLRQPTEQSDEPTQYPSRQTQQPPRRSSAFGRPPTSQPGTKHTEHGFRTLNEVGKDIVHALADRVAAKIREKRNQ